MNKILNIDFLITQVLYLYQIKSPQSLPKISIKLENICFSVISGTHRCLNTIVTENSRGFRDNSTVRIKITEF